MRRQTDTKENIRDKEKGKTKQKHSNNTNPYVHAVYNTNPYVHAVYFAHYDLLNCILPATNVALSTHVTSIYTLSQERFACFIRAVEQVDAPFRRSCTLPWIKYMFYIYTPVFSWVCFLLFEYRVQ